MKSDAIAVTAYVSLLHLELRQKCRGSSLLAPTQALLHWVGNDWLSMTVGLNRYNQKPLAGLISPGQLDDVCAVTGRNFDEVLRVIDSLQLLHEELLARSLPLPLRHDRGCVHRERPFPVLLASVFACCHLISPLFSETDRDDSR
jgi:hypothetical protein